MVLQPRICLADDRIHLRACIDDEHRVHALLCPVDGADDRRLPDSGLLVEHTLHIFGKDVEAVRRHDHFLLAALDEQPSLRVALADVSCVQPAFAVEHALCVGH